MYAQSIAKKFVKFYDKNGTPVKYWQKDFYEYCAGRYYLIKDTKTKVTAFLQKNIKNANITNTLINNTIENIKPLARLDSLSDTWIDDCPDIFEDVYHTVCFDNGLVGYSLSNATNSRRIVRPAKHNQNFFTLTQLPYNYDYKAKCPLWIKFLNEIMEDDKDRINLLQQWIKYVLGPTLKQQRFLMCVGEGANGKSVFTQVIEYLVGRENCSHVLLSNFKSRFSLAYTLNKKLNSTTESTKDISPLAETVLKSYVSGDEMAFEKKYQGVIEAVPTAKLMISTNERPVFNDRSEGVWRRLIYVPFNVTIPEKQQDKDLVDKLIQELPGIYNWANQVNLTNGFNVPAICTNSVNEYKLDINPAKAYLEKHYTYNDSFYIFCGSVYAKYTVYCRNNGYKPLSASEFGKEVSRVFPDVNKGQKQKDGKRHTAYRGLKLRRKYSKNVTK